jgi:hypothetical protein
MTKNELAQEINWAGGWQEYHQGIRIGSLLRAEPNWEMYYYWTERYNSLRKEYARRYADAINRQR